MQKYSGQPKLFIQLRCITAVISSLLLAALLLSIVVPFVMKTYGCSYLDICENETRGIYEDYVIHMKWKKVIQNFMDAPPIQSFSSTGIEAAYRKNENNIQNMSILIHLKNGKLFTTRSFPEKKHSRYSSALYIIKKVVSKKRSMFMKLRMKITFLVCVNDGINTSVAIFGSARHWRNWKFLIPVPLGNMRGEPLGWGSPLKGWDTYVRNGIVASRSRYPWEEKIPKALFRGNLRMPAYKLGSCNHENAHNCTLADNWRQICRGRMYIESSKRPDIFDVGFLENAASPEWGRKIFDGAPKVVDKMSFFDFQKYKLLLNVGSNADWAERLRMIMLTNSAVVKHEAEVQEFFYPLLEPWHHYIPTNLLFTDLVKNVQWALEHDDKTRKIVLNAHRFMKTYLSESSIELYWKITLEEFYRRQTKADGLPP